MSSKTADLSALKAEVAELWQQYRRDEAPVVDDAERRSLVQRATALEAQRRALAERSAMLRAQLERETARAVEPWQRLGVLAGLATSLGLVPLTLPALASLGLSHGQGLALVVLATVLPLVVFRRG